MYLNNYDVDAIFSEKQTRRPWKFSYQLLISSDFDIGVICLENKREDTQS